MNKTHLMQFAAAMGRNDPNAAAPHEEQAVMTKIGIIGSGNIGGALTRLFTKAGRQVGVANSRGPDSLGDLARETGARATHAEQARAGAAQ